VPDAAVDRFHARAVTAMNALLREAL
jgi:hypothetical protein